MRYLVKKVGTTTTFAVIVLTGCSASSLSQDVQGLSPTAQYLQRAPAGSFEPITNHPQLQPFTRLFAELNSTSIETDLDQVYAEVLFFNDTFHTFTERSQLKQYLLGLTQASQTQVRVLDTVAMGNDFLIRWSMHTHAKIAWKTLDIDSIGLTHLRLDDQGKIILHQDFWDAAGGFYEHLPLLGTPIKAIRSRLSQ